MKILLLCDYFEPIRMIGAVRPTDFAKCFLEMGHKVDVVTLWNEKWPHEKNNGINISVQRIDISESKYFKTYNFLSKIRKLKQNKTATSSQTKTNKKELKKARLSLKDYLKAFYNTKMPIVFGKAGGRAFYNCIKRKINDYDLVYTTYGGFSSILCGELIKKNNKKIRWISDFRDAVYYEMFTKANKNYYRNFVKNHCKKCDALVFASNGYLKDTILPTKFNGKVSVIENGFMEYQPQRNTSNEKMIFLYSGSMYGDRHLKSIFASIKKMDEKYKSLNVLINFCGDDESYSLFKREAKQFGIDKYVVYCGFLSSKLLNKAELMADVFLISSWNYSDYTGVLPGKLFEYLSYKKPIIGHVSGDEPNSLLKSMINENSLGFCADDIAENDYDFMYNTINKYYIEFLNNGFVSFKGNEDYLNCFLRRKQAKRILELVE